MPQSQINIRRLLIFIGLAVIFVGVAMIFVDTDMYPRKETPLPSSINLDTRFDIYQKLAEAKTLAGDGKHAEALASFDQLSQNAAGTRYGWNADIFAASSLGHLGQFDTAVARLDRAIAECPLEDQVPLARVIKADVTSMAGRHDEALQMIDPLVDEYVESHPSVSVKALFNIYRIYDRQGHHGMSWAALERICEEYPGAEDSHKRAAEHVLSYLEESVREQQRDMTKQLIDQGTLRHITKLDEGTVTWTAEHGPYLITHNLVVDPGTQLTIHAGTEVRFGSDGGLSVEGTMDAIGTEQQPIRFISLNDDPDREWWNGVQVTAADATIRLHHCQIEGATVAIAVEEGKVELDRCKIARCGGVSVHASRKARLQMANCDVIKSRRVGIKCDDGAVVQIQDCRIGDAKSHGVVLKEVGDSSFLRTSIKGSGRNGMRIRGDSDPIIKECLIQDNSVYGIECIDGASPKILASVIANNGSTGIRLQRWDSLIQNSEITGNHVGGIYADARCQGQIDGNTVQDNESFGVHLRLACSTAITSNRVIGNHGTGLWLEQGSVPNQMSNNQFSDNTNAALRNESNTAVDAGGNWWGTTNRDQIAQRVQDQHDNPEWGLVTLDPLLEEASTH